MAIDTSGTGPALADITAIATPPPPLAWTGGASAGLLATGGNSDVSSTRVDGELIARTPRDRYTATAIVNRAEDTGRETSNNWTAALAYDRFISERLFAQASTILTNDRFRDLDLRTALGAGIGYQVWDSPLTSLSVNAGLGYVHENFDGAPNDSYAAARESAKLDLYFADKRVSAFHHHDGYFGVTGDDNLFFRMQNGVRLAVVSGFVTTAQVDIDYDRSPAAGRVSTDRSFSLTFGYRF
jgi:putative salt-induced outer membrane protein YdiY